MKWPGKAHVVEPAIGSGRVAVAIAAEQGVLTLEDLRRAYRAVIHRPDEYHCRKHYSERYGVRIESRERCALVMPEN